MKNRAIAAVMMCAFAQSPAFAQSGEFIAGIIGEAVRQANSGSSVDDRPCLSGRVAASDRRRERMSESTQESMARYVQLAAAAPVANVEGAFARGAKENSWQVNGVTSPLSAVSDPLAAFVTAEHPLTQADALQMSGDGASVFGIWSVRNGSGQLVGHYRAAFQREWNDWRLSGLQILMSEAAPEALRPYCHVPGDIDSYLENYDHRGNYIGPNPQDGPLTSVNKDEPAPSANN